jgi:hypothetical protein
MYADKGAGQMVGHDYTVQTLQTSSHNGMCPHPWPPDAQQRFRWSVVVWWACQDLNLEPHPYQG